jgi:2-dehydro-3-deoxygluconokinase
MFGNEEDLSAALGYEIPGGDPRFERLDPGAYAETLQEVAADFPALKVIATTLRVVHSASVNDWAGICYAADRVVATDVRRNLEILDRIGGGDSFASGMIYGLLCGFPIEEALEYGVAHGALAMTTPGDTSKATLADVQALVAGAGARVKR